MFTAVALVVLSKVDGMVEDQHDYVLRQAREREAEQGGDSDMLSEITSDPKYLDGVFEDDQSFGADET